VTVRLVRIAGWLTLTGSVFSIPASLALTPQPPATNFLLTAAVAMIGTGFLLAPERWLSPGWIHAAIACGTVAAVLRVVVFSDDYTFYFVLVAVYAAYALPTRRDLAIYLAAMTPALGVSVVLSSDGNLHEEGLHPALVTLPVMLISAVAVRELRERLEQRERRYRRFAYEAVALAIRIRGSRQRRAGAEHADDLDRRLDELASRAEHAAEEEGLHLGLRERI
jgi:hypothetical protein